MDPGYVYIYIYMCVCVCVTLIYMAFILLYFIGVIQTSTHEIDNLFQDRPRGPDHGSRRAQRSHGW